MAQATWHTSNHGFFPRSFRLPGFRIRPPGEEAGLVIAICAIVGAVIFLQLQGAVRPRPGEGPGISIQSVAPLPAVPPPPAITAPPVEASSPVPLEHRPAVDPVQVAPSQPGPVQRASIRSVDLASLPALRNLTAQTGLSVDPALVSYGAVGGADDVAIVPLRTDGSGGTLAVAVVGLRKEGPQVLALLTPEAVSRGRMRVAVEAGQVVATMAVPGPEDALCCPSQTRRVYYTWDGSRLRLDRDVTTSNAPSAKD